MASLPRSTTPVVLIVTNREDLTADFMIMRLRERGLPYYRLNSDDLASTTVTLRIGGEAIVRRLESAATAVDLERIGCVWYRRAVRPPAPAHIEPDFRTFAAAELRHLYEGLIAGPDVRWVNPLEASDLAERKVYQLRLAAAHGLLVPPTVISNDPSVLTDFAAAEARVICKPISQGLVGTGGQLFAVHTHEVAPTELAEPQVLAGFPTLLQRLVPKGTDVRLTLIGNDTYPVEVLVPDGGPVDWRATADGLSYRRCTVPPEIEHACRSLMSALGIVYGAFDFVRTNEGEWYFLEVNPAGEWAWLEVELDLPMRDSFINLFWGA